MLIYVGPPSFCTCVAGYADSSCNTLVTCPDNAQGAPNCACNAGYSTSSSLPSTSLVFTTGAYPETCAGPIFTLPIFTCGGSFSACADGSSSSYSVLIREEVAVDFYVGRVLAIEPIFTSRVTILYAVESGGPFTADRTSGIISTTELLSASLHNIDKATREYVLTISATFVSFSPLVINDKISYTTMIVGIIPKFLAPVFTASAYYAALDYGFNRNEELLQAAPGQLVTIITAKPEERFLNQVRIVYSLVDITPHMQDIYLPTA